ncbi:Glutathione synthetase [Balamuthia mandrillaris]
MEGQGKNEGEEVLLSPGAQLLAEVKDGKQLEERLVRECCDWALCHGLVMGAAPALVSAAAQGAQLYTHAPFSLFPSPVPRHCFEQAQALATDFNLLVHRVSQRHSFLFEGLRSASEADPFTGRLVQLLRQIQEEGGRPQDIELGLHRSDYMFHVRPEDGTIALQQVELNTISAAFAGLSSKVSQMHSFVINKIDAFGKAYKGYELPHNDAAEVMVSGFANAVKLYGNSQAVVMMVVQPDERNTADQRCMEYILWKRYGIHMIRRSLADIQQRGAIDPTTKALTIDGKEIAVVYYRAGYTPKDYPTEKEWEARTMVERSKAVCCPSVAYHLVGTKKVQQLLSKPGLLAQFFDKEDQEESARMERLLACFTRLYSLDEDEEGDQAAQLALNNPDDFVMKPQREGGGNNIYNEEVRKALQTFTPKERRAYILMERIRPKPFQTYSCKAGVPSCVTAISELGIYSVWLSRSEEVVMNQKAGHLLRTKVASDNEGGVAAGFAFLDSPCLV